MYNNLPNNSTPSKYSHTGGRHDDHRTLEHVNSETRSMKTSANFEHALTTSRYQPNLYSPPRENRPPPSNLYRDYYSQNNYDSQPPSNLDRDYAYQNNYDSPPPSNLDRDYAYQDDYDLQPSSNLDIGYAYQDDYDSSSPINLDMDYASQNNYDSPPPSNVRPLYNAGQHPQDNMYSPPPNKIERKLSVEELKQKIKEIKEQIRQAKLRIEFQRLQEEQYELESHNSSYSRDSMYIQKLTSTNNLSNFSKHQSGHPQRSEHLKPASPGPESTVRARTPSTSANDLSNISEHQSGHPQRSALLQLAPQQLEPSLLIKTQVLFTPSNTNAGTEQITSGSTPRDITKKCESPDATNYNKNHDKESENKLTFQMTHFPTTYPINLPLNHLFIADLETNIIFLVYNKSKSSILSKDLTGIVSKYFQPQRKPLKGFCNKTTNPMGSTEAEPRTSKPPWPPPRQTKPQRLPKPPWPPPQPPSPSRPPPRPPDFSQPPPICTSLHLPPMPVLFLLISSIITRYAIVMIFACHFDLYT